MRISEVYVSTQGEGPRVGLPTVFLRFAGCNLKCASWPCDTQHAIDPKYRSQWLQETAIDVVNRVHALTKTTGAKNICLTGGEPLLQKSDELKELVYLLSNFYDLECFSNGTLEYPDWFLYLVKVVMDWKLPGSGEWEVGQKVRVDNFNLMDTSHTVKFTIADQADFEQARDVYYDHVIGWRGEVYAGIVWGKEMTNARLVELILEEKLPWRLTTQVHNMVWPRDQRGT